MNGTSTASSVSAKPPIAFRPVCGSTTTRAAEELASLEDTLELLSDPVAMADLRESRDALASGDVMTGDELRAKYLKR